MWFLVALVVDAVGSSAADGSVRDAVEESSRFVYLLLYFPLADLLAAEDERVQLTWLVPALVLAVVTWLLWLGLETGDPSYRDHTSAFFYDGIFGRAEDSSSQRVFFGNQVLFAPALALLVGRLARGAPLRWTLPPVALVGSAMVIAHTRGLWLGVAVAVAFAVALSVPRATAWVARHVRALSAAVLVVVVALSVVLLTRGGSPGFLRDGSSLTRVDQAPLLTDGWLASPVWGSGMGAALGNGYVRSSAAPWAFELTYLQLLFQVGVVGLLLVLWPLAGAVATAVRRAASGEDGRRAAWSDAGGLLPVTGTAGLLALYVATATNPYLLSSVGMTCAALGMALASGRPALPARVVAMPSRRWSIAFAVLLAAFVGTALEFRADRVPGGGPGSGAVQDVAVVSRLQVPIAGARWATDGDLALRDEPAYAVRPGRRTTVTAVDVSGATARIGRRFAARVRDVGAGASYDVSHWDAGARTPVLAVLEPRGDRVRTRFVSLDGRSRTLAEGTVTLPPPAPGVQRDLHVARTTFDDGRRPALVVVDRAAGFPGATVTIVGGDDDYRAVLYRVYAFAKPSPPATWRSDTAITAPGGSFQRGGLLNLLLYRVDDPRGTFAIRGGDAAGNFSTVDAARSDVRFVTPGGGTQVVTGQLAGRPVAYVARPGPSGSTRLDVVQTKLLGNRYVEPTPTTTTPAP